MHTGDGRGGEVFDDKIPVADRVHRIAGDAIEAEKFGDVFAVDVDGAAGNRAGTERGKFGAFGAISEPVIVATEHADVGKQMMREEYRLRSLQVCVARHDYIGIAVGES